MSEQKPRTCVGCGTVGFKWFTLQKNGWFCADCHGLYKNRADCHARIRKPPSPPYARLRKETPESV